MCGIAGIVGKDPHPDTEEKIRSATRCLRHRGPEGEGFWINAEGTAALGHQRLRIIDLTETAAQPMAYLDRYRIVHNGELYNYLEIRSELEKKGYAFRSQSDTEVIVAAYDAWGQDCLQHFDGMFAFAVWDDREHRLFAARDRFGEKPFFFFYGPQQLLFASEMKALWQMGIPRQVNPAMVYNFLTIGYTSNPADPEETFFRQVSKLPPASFLSYSPSNHTVRIEKYWQAYVDVKAIGEAAAIEQFRYLLGRSVQRRLRSDVPVGTSLSGGLDSSALVAFCDQQASGPYAHECFTATFSEFSKDESRYADTVARKFGLKHHLVQFSDSGITGLMDRVMQHQEEPIGSASALVQFRVFESARDHAIPVLLDGQGADETLAGYHKYYKWYWQELYRHKELNKTGERKAAAALGVHEPFGLAAKIAALFPEFAAGLLQSRRSRQAFHHPDLDRSFAFAHKYDLVYATPAEFSLNGALYFNTFVNGLEELLRLADRNSMAHGVEVRLPFLDHSLVEFLFSLPPGYKIHEGWTKWLLRRSVEERLPEEITWRKDKIGLEPPQKRWMEQKEVKEAIEEAKRKLQRQGVLSPHGARKKVKPHSAYAAKGYDWRYWTASYLYD